MELTDLFDPGTKEAQDLKKVTEAYREDLESRILSGTVSVEEIVDWYYSIDPIAEYSWLENIFYERKDAKPESQNVRAQKASKMATLFELAGIKLLLNSLNISKTEYHELGLNTGDLSDVMNNLFNLVEKKPLILDKLDLTYVAADCLVSAADIYAHRSFEDTEGISPDIKRIKTKFLAYYKISHILIEKIVIECIEQINNGNYEYFNIGLLSTMEYASTLFATANCISTDSTDSAKRKHEILKDTFSLLIETIKAYFVDKPRTKKAIKGSEKGNLFEILWFLDMNFLSNISDGKIAGTVVSPASNRLDRPRIGWPEKKRGFDMRIEIPHQQYSNGYPIRLSVQLKANSTGENNGVYHNKIPIIAENNLLDAGLSRLKARLKAFEEWIESDLGEVAQQNLMRYILKSAKEYFDSIEKAIESPNDLIVNSIDSALLTDLGLATMMGALATYFVPDE